jgi:histidine ammonia-lyase
MDKMKSAIVKLSMLAERQINFLFNSKLNNKLQPFINLGKLGVNFGMQGTQFTATSTVAENQTLAFPMSIHSISCNNDNQDIVSMGTNAALMTKRVIDNSYQVLSIELMAIIQAFDYLNIIEQSAAASKNVYHTLRKISPKFEADTVRYKEIEAIKKYIIANDIDLLIK